MGITHPPLESLLTFSQTCLEGFEQSCLNRISNLRKEVREIFEEQDQYEVGARLARWILDGRRPGDAAPSPTRAAPPVLLSHEVALLNAARGAAQLASPQDHSSAPDCSSGSMLELRGCLALEWRLPFRRVAVSLDASAALRSLESHAAKHDPAALARTTH